MFEVLGGKNEIRRNYFPSPSINPINANIAIELHGFDVIGQPPE